MDERAVTAVVQDLAWNPLASARILLALAAENPDALYSLAAPLLRRISEGPEGRFVLALLRSKASFPSPLLDRAFLTSADSEKLAVLRSNADSSARSLQPREDTPLSGDGEPPLPLLRLLDLGKAADGPLLPSLLLHHESPRVRSKAAMLAGQTDQLRDWMRFLRAEPDSRVRANVVESLWTSPQPGARDIFRSFARDSEPRVAANAVVGLHKRGSPGDAEESASLVLKMAESGDVRFAASAAWAMGATEDPRYLPVLEGLVRRSGPHLKCAFQALRKLRGLKPGPA